ncbi:MAG: hypothetical protein DA408_13055 [Bacteroidetes bacterium]|nr:MAG: hypothetical protein C7N36_04090 [Bacteroidota bacterium]PTM11643.1 MAG: hypothetical protein DA408_13055 [Bacteroidota bacterium]
MPGGFIVTSGRVIKKAVLIGNKTWHFAWREIGGRVVFSNSSSYRSIWKNVYPALNSSDNIAHHVIPQAIWENPLVQKAARANPALLPNGVDPFHMNMPSNGFPVHTSRHTGNHGSYSTRITQELQRWTNSNPNATAEQAATALSQWQMLLKNAIGASTSGPNINTIILPTIP